MAAAVLLQQLCSILCCGKRPNSQPNAADHRNSQYLKYLVDTRVLAADLSILQVCCSKACNMTRAPRLHEAPPQTRRDRSGIHRLEEFGVVLGVAELVEQEVDRIHSA